MLIAAWAFAKGSPELHAKLRADPRFGPSLRNWEDHGSIPPKAKLMAVGAMAVSLLILVLTVRRPLVIELTAAVLACVAAFILTRPSGPKPVEPKGDETKE